MPRTPSVARPIARASASENRIAWPLRETSRMSSPFETWRTATSSSPSRILIAMIPSALSGVLYSRERRLLHDAVLGRAEEVLGLLEVPGLDDGAHLLVLAERQQVDDRAALRLARPERQLVHLQAVDLADGGEEEDVVVGRGDEEVLDVVVLLHLHAHDADAAAPLLPVGGRREPLDVAGASDRDHHVLVRDQVLELELLLGGDDLGAPVVAAAVDLP